MNLYDHGKQNSVQDLMLVFGGLDESAQVIESASVIQNDGSECTKHNLPNLPKRLKNFGVVSINDQLIILCGGTVVTSKFSSLYQLGLVTLTKQRDS